MIADSGPHYINLIMTDHCPPRPVVMIDAIAAEVKLLDLIIRYPVTYDMFY